MNILYSDDRSIHFNFFRQKSRRKRAFYEHWSSPVFLTNILKYRLDRQLIFRWRRRSSSFGIKKLLENNRLFSKQTVKSRLIISRVGKEGLINTEVPQKTRETNLQLFHPRRNVTVVWEIIMQKKTVQLKMLSVMPVENVDTTHRKSHFIYRSNQRSD